MRFFENFPGAKGKKRKSTPPLSLAKGFDGYEQKLSDALLDVAAPLLAQLKPTNALQAERVAMLAALAWNAELLEDVDSERYAPLAKALASEGDAIRKIVDTMRERKRTRHGDDDRLVVGVEVTGSAPDMRFRAAGTSLRRGAPPSSR